MIMWSGSSAVERSPEGASRSKRCPCSGTLVIGLKEVRAFSLVRYAVMKALGVWSRVQIPPASLKQLEAFE